MPFLFFFIYNRSRLMTDPVEFFIVCVCVYSFFNPSNFFLYGVKAGSWHASSLTGAALRVGGCEWPISVSAESESRFDIVGKQ